MRKKADEWTRQVIGAAIEVHRELGPGLLESVYEKCFVHECRLRNIPVEQQLSFNVRYKGLLLESGLKADVLVDTCLLVELKAVDAVLPIHKAQLFSYMKLLKMPVGLLINFKEEKLVNGVHRIYLPV